MKIGYGKLGRSMPLTLEKCGNLGGDVECVAVVKEMALRHPNDEFWLLGRNSGEDPQSVGLPPNVFNPWWSRGWSGEIRKQMQLNGIKGNMSVEQHLKMREIFSWLTMPSFVEMDAHVWWVGQHGSSNSPIPMTDGSGKLTKPHDSYAFYSSYVFQGINAWRDVDPVGREEIYLNADARNKHKMRDLKYPLQHPILTQYNFTNPLKHEQYDGSPLKTSTVQNVYSRLEINGLAPGTPFGDLIRWNPDYDRPYEFGMFINEARAIGVKDAKKRVNVMKEWVLPLNPHWVHGTWSEDSQRELGMKISPAPWDQYYPLLNATRCTFTTPSSGSGWATAKPWEAFAGGTVCFFHPDYDDQNNILGDANPKLREWLRVPNPKALKDRVIAVNESPAAFQWLITEQRKHFDNAMSEKRYLKLIEERIWK